MGDRTYEGKIVWGWWKSQWAILAYSLGLIMLGSVSSIWRTIINPSFVTMIQEGEVDREKGKRQKKKKNPVEPKRYLQTHVHSSISHLHPKVEAWLFAPIRFHVDCGGNSQVAGAELIRRPDSRWTDKHSVVHPYDGTLLSFQKEWSSDTCYSMDESENTC